MVLISSVAAGIQASPLTCGLPFMAPYSPLAMPAGQ